MKTLFLLIAVLSLLSVAIAALQHPNLSDENFADMAIMQVGGVNVGAGGALCVGQACMSESTVGSLLGLAGGQVVRGRYVKIQKSNVDCMNLSEVQVYSVVGGANIALGKPAMMSSGYGGGSGWPEALTDGILDNLAHSSCYDQAWALIDLGAVMPIAHIRVFNRHDLTGYRSNGLVLSILDQQSNPVFTSDPFPSIPNDWRPWYVFDIQPPSTQVIGSNAILK